MKPSLVCWDYADRPALLSETGQVITYSKLYEDIKRLAQILSKRQMVFLLGENDCATIIAYLACLEAGAVPLLLDKNISPEFFYRLVNIYEPSYFFLQDDNSYISESFHLVGAFGGYSLFLKTNVNPLILPADLALLLATSGSTGSPKLVRLTYQNLVSNANSIIEYLGINKDERAITSLPFNYSYGLSVINSHLAAGASVVLSGRSFFDAAFWPLFKSQKVTSLAGVPYSYEILLKLKFERMELPSLRTLTQAGGKMDISQALRINEICQLKGIRFFPMYGQTEATARIAYLPPADFAHKAGSIGYAIPRGRLWIEDNAGNVIHSSDQEGELIYSGPNVSLGYAECKADLMRGDEWHGVLRTGDLARQDKDGFFYIVGRKSRFFKIFGVRGSLDAVENWFMHRQLVAAAHGNDDCLCVSVECDDHIDLKNHTLELAAEMRIHPSAIRIFALQSLPRLSSGKVDYPCLNSMK